MFGNMLVAQLSSYFAAWSILANVATAQNNNSTKFRFLNSKSKAYAVQSLPVVSDQFDIGELYSGLVPVYNDPSRALYFVFQPTVAPNPVDEITIWLNGGPGCSSLEGFFQENGLWLWQPGTQQPVLNEFSWVNLTNMLWVEQPVGTGFSPGKLNITSEEQVAEEFLSWFKNFQQIFGIKNFKIYVTGESYAGRYIPYISAAMLDSRDQTHFDMKGALLYDPVIGQQNHVLEVTLVPFAQQNNNLFNLDTKLLATLTAKQESCGFKDYLDKYLVFPPKGVQPRNVRLNSSCYVSAPIGDSLSRSNPCGTSYNLAVLCPAPWDVLQDNEPYFDRADVKKAMHAPLRKTWVLCNGLPLARDTSLPPIVKVLPKVIEGTNRVLISNGDLDNNVITNSTLLNIQNMTFNGLLGFQKRPSTPINIQLKYTMRSFPFNAAQGIMGVSHYERGLMWAESFQAGHQQPQYQPRVAYRHIQWVLGRINAL